MKRLVLSIVMLLLSSGVLAMPTAKELLFKNHGVAVGITIDNCFRCHSHDKYKGYDLKNCNVCHIVPPGPPTNVRVE